MELLQALEQKITGLLSTIKELKTENQRLIEENERFSLKIASMTDSLQHETKNFDLLNQEKLKTTELIEDLIRSIDSLMNEHRP